MSKTTIEGAFLSESWRRVTQFTRQRYQSNQSASLLVFFMHFALERSHGSSQSNSRKTCCSFSLAALTLGVLGKPDENKKKTQKKPKQKHFQKHAVYYEFSKELEKHPSVTILHNFQNIALLKNRTLHFFMTLPTSRGKVCVCVCVCVCLCLWVCVCERERERERERECRI